MNTNKEQINEEPLIDTNEENKVNETPEANLDEPVEKEEQDPIAKLQAEVAEQKNNFLRLYADFENYKKRSVKERIDLLKSASSEVISSMLPVLDDFERALKASEGLEDNHPLREGVLLIYNKLKSQLEQKGLKPMESIGFEFDSDFHDAITSMQVSEEKKGKVIEEVEKGYFLNDKVIRHAKVIVGS